MARIIAISGGDSTGRMDLREDAVLMGAAATRAKPFELEDLVRTVGAVLGEP